MLCHFAHMMKLETLGFYDSFFWASILPDIKPIKLLKSMAADMQLWIRFRFPTEAHQPADPEPSCKRTRWMSGGRRRIPAPGEWRTANLTADWGILLLARDSGAGQRIKAVPVLRLHAALPPRHWWYCQGWLESKKHDLYYMAPGAVL